MENQKKCEIISEESFKALAAASDYQCFTGQEAATMRTLCKRIFADWKYTHITEADWDGGCMNTSVWSYVRQYLKDFQDCWAIVEALLSLWDAYNPLSSPGAMSLNKTALEKQIDIINAVPSNWISKVAYNSCKTGAFNAAYAGIASALMFPNCQENRN